MILRIRKKLKGLLLILAFLLIYLPAADARKDFVYSINIIGVCIIVIFFLLSLRHKKAFIDVIGGRALFILLIFTIFHFPSFIGPGSFSTFSHLFSIYFVYIVLIRNADIKLIHLALSASLLNIYLLYRCVVELDFAYSAFVGTAINTNQFSMVLIGGVVGAVYLLLKFDGVFLKILSLFLIGSGLLLVVVSSSRTAMFVVIIVVLASFRYFMLTNLRKRERNIVLTISYIVTLCLVLVFYHELYDFFFNKWNDRSAGLLSGRLDIWEAALTSLPLAGDLDSTINANSEFVNYLILYGVLPFVGYIFFSFSVLCMSVKYHMREKSLESLFYLLIVFAFLFDSFFENYYAVFGKSIHVMYWSVVGFLMNVNTKYSIVKKDYAQNHINHHQL